MHPRDKLVDLCIINNLTDFHLLGGTRQHLSPPRRRLKHSYSSWVALTRESVENICSKQTDVVSLHGADMQFLQLWRGWRHPECCRRRIQYNSATAACVGMGVPKTRPWQQTLLSPGRLSSSPAAAPFTVLENETASQAIRRRLLNWMQCHTVDAQ